MIKKFSSVDKTEMNREMIELTLLVIAECCSITLLTVAECGSLAYYRKQYAFE